MQQPNSHRLPASSTGTGPKHPADHRDPDFFLRGFESIGVILLRQQLSFSREFLFNVAVQLVSVPVTILLAFELRSYLALALGMMLKDITQTLLSYAFAPYRSQFTLRGWQELWGMSRWLMVLSVLGALHSRVSALMLGKIASPINQ